MQDRFAHVRSVCRMGVEPDTFPWNHGAHGPDREEEGGVEGEAVVGKSSVLRWEFVPNNRTR